MIIAYNIILFFSILCLLHSYLIFPAVLKILSANKKLPGRKKVEEKDLPHVCVLMAAYNEEKVISEKIKSVFQTSYPVEKLKLIIGSDGSTDLTDTIIQSFISREYPVIFKRFAGRNGKAYILNELSEMATGEILILTDANIYFTEALVPVLVSHFTDESVGLVGANIINTGMRSDGISFQEETYIQRENMIKYREGVLWGTMMGAFGACYAIRKSLFPPIPANFLMEDFYITMHVLAQGKKAINELGAIAYEDVSNLIKEEFKRKTRISAGNYQNLGVYYRYLFLPFSKTGFSFISHKFLRWMGPFLIFLAYISSILLIHQNLFYLILFILQTIGFLMPFIDTALKRMNIHIFAIRLVSYFYIMNAALFLGFIKYARGIRTSVWNPTIRNIETDNQ
ncbi:MAG: glycosyltransferase [Chitinophagales bacterium]|nr:glycosyltransferase [Chitinophagales bacterium]